MPWSNITETKNAKPAVRDGHQQCTFEFFFETDSIKRSCNVTTTYTKTFLTSVDLKKPTEITVISLYPHPTVHLANEISVYLTVELLDSYYFECETKFRKYPTESIRLQKLVLYERRITQFKLTIYDKRDF